MSEIEAAPGWLNEKDRSEWEWAARYLLRRCSSSLQSSLSALADSNFSYLVRSIHALENEAEGVKLIERLRNAIRQRRYRLAEGGRKTCSFTLPLETKTTLKRLAKNQRTTETALLERLIEGAAQVASAQKEVMRRDAQEAKVMRNSHKLALELDKIRIDQARKQLHHCMKQLTRWETFLKEDLPELSSEDEATATALAERRMRAAQEAIDAAVAKHEMLSPRVI